MSSSQLPGQDMTPRSPPKQQQAGTTRIFSPPKQRPQALIAQEEERKRQRERTARREQGTQQHHRQANWNHQQLQPIAVQRRSLFDQKHQMRQLLSRHHTSMLPVTKEVAGKTSQSNCNAGKDTDVINLTGSPEPATAGQAGNVQLPLLCSLLQPQVCITAKPALSLSRQCCMLPGLTRVCMPLSSDAGICRVRLSAVIWLLMAWRRSFQSRRSNEILDNVMQPSLALRHQLLALCPRSGCSDLTLLLSSVLIKKYPCYAKAAHVLTTGWLIVYRWKVRATMQLFQLVKGYHLPSIRTEFHRYCKGLHV